MLGVFAVCGSPSRAPTPLHVRHGCHHDLLATPLAIIKTSIDGLPSIEIPVFSVIWSCAGMPAKDVSERFTSSSGRLWLCSED
jgi:hypothetical protein